MKRCDYSGIECEYIDKANRYIKMWRMLETKIDDILFFAENKIEWEIYNNVDIEMKRIEKKALKDE